MAAAAVITVLLRVRPLLRPQVLPAAAPAHHLTAAIMAAAVNPVVVVRVVIGKRKLYQTKFQKVFLTFFHILRLSYNILSRDVCLSFWKSQLCQFCFSYILLYIN